LLVDPDFPSDPAATVLTVGHITVLRPQYRGGQAFMALLAEAGIEWTNQGPDELANAIAKELLRPAPSSAERPAWLPAWATEQFFRDNAAVFGRNTPPTTIDGLTIQLPSAPATDKLPSISDFPELSDPAKYWEWRSVFSRFSASISVPISSLAVALNRTLSRFTGTTTSMVNAFDVSALVRDSWSASAAALIAATDKAFLSAKYLDVVSAAFRAVRPHAGEDAPEFLRRFLAARNLLNEVAIATGEPDLVVHDEELRRQFLAVISADTRTALRAHHGLVSVVPWDELARSVEFRWVATKPRTSPAPAAAPASGSRSSGSSPAAAPGPAPPSRNKCGVTLRYDDAPAVPAELHGPVFRWAGKGRAPFSPAQTAENEARNGRGRAAGVCLSCRRPRSAHGPGNMFAEVPSFASGAVAAAGGQGV
jgi:hypothetical protein